MHAGADGLIASEKKSAAGEKRFVITMGDRTYTVCSSVSSFVNSPWSMTFSEESSTSWTIGHCDIHLPGGRHGIALDFRKAL